MKNYLYELIMNTVIPKAQIAIIHSEISLLQNNYEIIALALKMIEN